MGLATLFRERGWSNPHGVEPPEEMSGPELLALLDIPTGSVEVLFVNRRAWLFRRASSCA